MPNSTTKRRPRKSDKPTKPYATFPLSPHANGKWQKKIRGTIYYFGNWARRKNGRLVRVEGDGWKEALALYQQQAAALHSGRVPRNQNSEGLDVAELCNRFLTAKMRKVKSGELTPRSFNDYKQATDLIVSAFGAHRLVSDLRSEDFEALRATMSESWGPVRLGKFVQCVRTVFKFAFDCGLIDQPVRYGPEFKRPSADVLRRHRASAGKRLFTVDEIQQLLAGKTIIHKRTHKKEHLPGASVQLQAMILLGINCGFGNTDVAKLPLSAVDLERGWIDFPRPKTGIARRCPLWPETVAALKVAISERKRPKRDAGAVFITQLGNDWMHGTTDAVGQEFRKLLQRLGINGRLGLGFYSLRHTHRTVADATKDFPAVRLIMGHADASIDAVYREQIDDERLIAVTQHVHDWLFGTGRKRRKRSR
jgi:integrase